MAKPVVGVTPKVLRWARESQGYSIDDVASKMGREREEVVAWEDEEEPAAPTYAQLEKLAYKVYRRPIAVFFLPSPPSEPNLKQEFRTLPEFEIEHLSADTRYQLRVARAFQVSLTELTGGSNPSEHLIFRDISLSSDDRVVTAAKEIRHYLGVPLSEQVGWSSTADALKEWRSAVEDVGVFVFKNSFKQKDISGFCLSDSTFPVIYINNSTAKSRQIFTLFHELCHLLLKMNDILKADESYLDHLADPEREVEALCNALTAEILIPSEDFNPLVEPVREWNDGAVYMLAQRYHVSREAILRRALDLRLVSREYYETKAGEWAKEAEAAGGEGGGNYYTTQASYLGEPYLRLVFANYYQGRISLEQAADYLRVRTASIGGLESVMLGRETST